MRLMMGHWSAGAADVVQFLRLCCCCSASAAVHAHYSVVSRLRAFRCCSNASCADENYVFVWMMMLMAGQSEP